MSVLSERPKRLAIMGGTFDPIHIGHLVTAEAVSSEFNVDKVIFIPTGHPPHKLNTNMTTTEHRYLMTVLATAANTRFEVSRLEIDREGVTYTIDTIKELKKIYGEDIKLYFITGADAIHEILNWKHPKELLQICDFVAVTRPGYKKEHLKEQVALLEREFGANIYFLEVPALAISSSDIRRRVKEDRTIKYLVTESVEQYICKHKLYTRELNLTDELKKQMIEYVQTHLSEKRYAHTKGVVEMALELANIYGINYEAAFIAALFHDVAKELPNCEQRRLCIAYGIVLDAFEEEHIDMAHGKIASAILQKEWGIEEEDILNSVSYHTVGRRNMSDLEKVIFLADMVEKGRKPFKGKEEIQSLATYDLNKAMYMAIQSSKNYVENILKKEVHPATNELLAIYSE